ncbi:acetyl-CoA carboxylase biotin carboxyl carrier protein [Pseudomonas sp. X10]
MKIDEVRQLAVWLGAAGLSALELKRGDETLLLRRAVQVARGSSSPVVAPAHEGASEPSRASVTASGPGLFFATHPDEAAPYVQGGDVLSQGQLVGVLRVGMLFLPVRSNLAGRVRQVLVADGQAVGYGQALIELEEFHCED